MQIKHLLTLSIGLFLAKTTFAQKPYFQQETNIKMDVKLDDTKHQVAGSWQMEYINNSPDTLSFIYIHIYPNAYKNNRTALAKQLFQQEKKKKWFFAEDSERGFIDNLDFKDKNNQSQKWEYDAQHIDIAKVYLSKPLAPKDTLHLSSNFRVQLTEMISRLGHVGESYQLTQWFPKPAVYDHKGWHQMPYLDQGEFYSEFGNYDVKITVPKNYVVGASGDLQTESEKAFLDSLAALPLTTNKIDSETNTAFPLSEKETKTLHYTLNNVHDFAWFADKRFHVRKDSVQLNSGRWITTWAMFTEEEKELWLEATHYLNRSVKFYSDIVGEYPYNVCTAVQSALSAGAGMEYPTITVIGKSGNAYALDQVITHEVGHNWFYGILASDERTYPWMDEGWNSYVESRYTDTYYGEDYSDVFLMTLLQARRGENQPIDIPADENTNLNYYVSAYGKPTLVFRHLERYLGKEKMDAVLKKYFETWKFKHPYPEDLRQLFEAETGQDLSWLFDIAIGTAKEIDYAIKKYKFENGKAEITIANKGDGNIVFSLGANGQNGKLLQENWYYFQGKDTTIILENLSPEVTSFEINAYANKFSPDLNISNNKVYTKGNGSNLGFSIGASIKKFWEKRINVFPTIGGNAYDGFMLGLSFYNAPVPFKKVQYYISPLYGFRSKEVVGMAGIEWNNFNEFAGTKDKYRGFTLGAYYKGFHFAQREVAAINEKFNLRYDKLHLYGILWLPRKVVNYRTEHYLRLDNHIISEEYASFQFDSTGLVGMDSDKRNWRSTHTITHFFEEQKPFTNYAFKTQLQYSNYKTSTSTEHFVKLTATAKFKWTYLSKRTIDLRLFAGGFLFHSDRRFGAMPLQMASRNFTDYNYEEFFFGRTNQTGLWSQQISLADGGFKTPIYSSTADGHSNSFLFAMNFKMSLPIKALRFIKPYIDAGYFHNSQPALSGTLFQDRIMVNGGFMLDLFDQRLGIYFPLFGTQDLMNQTKSLGGFGKRISFNINLHDLAPRKLSHLIDKVI